ncbi:hypothetical protein N7478_013023 [Penicillium angulare]|uniref:uncharacterized protein n=1 Tax=Penicillium angulare TaxID=116970 RepID=UPI00253FFA95|nr:uncharacterized protein N7478_013023 [Penicillium angulare]KAJ5256919.1 hypothetical protein N7478_013023 [Penicillium angulare]
MSWDKVIQDSDEDEPLIEDDFPASPDPLQTTQSPVIQHHDHPEEKETFLPLQHNANQGFPEPQLNVNFDQFLQSQGTHVTSTSSQQQREERWIPATCEGGGGSIGGIMTEIGIAQDQLFNDNASSAAQRLPSTATHYPSEISQPGSFPAMESYNREQYNPVAYGNTAHAMIPHDVPYEATQLLVPGPVVPYDYSTLAATTDISSPSDGNTALTSAPLSENMHTNLSKAAPHRAKSMQSMQYSPHDTEPFSSVTSPRLNRAKSDTARPGLISPRHSPSSTHDELALPTVAVEVPSVTKRKRGRPSKASLQDNDDDDELALTRNPEPIPIKLSGNQLPEQIVEPVPIEATHESSVEQAVEPEKEIPDTLINTEAVESNDQNTTISAVAENKNKRTAKEPKKKKVKRSKTASAAMQKSQISDIDDDIIWVDSRPLQAQDAQDAQEESKSKADAPQKEIPQQEPTVLNDTSTNVTKPGKAPPKKRGRKPKKSAEQVAEDAPDPADEADKADISLDHADSNSVGVDKLQNPSLPDKDETNNASIDIAPSSDVHAPTDPPSIEDDKTSNSTEPGLQTPQRSDQKLSTPVSDIKAQKGVSKNSPITSTSKVPYRVGLSKRARIAPLLKIVRK